jgi:hypothetical protein
MLSEETMQAGMFHGYVRETCWLAVMFHRLVREPCGRIFVPWVSEGTMPAVQ